jgi:penicillin-binding protein 2
MKHLYRFEGLDWKNGANYLYKFGLGHPLGLIFLMKKEDKFHHLNLYNSIYGENRWKWSTINSISIGQGEILISPLQMANYAAIIANKGYYYIPHVIKAIGEDGQPKPKYREKHYVGIDSVHFQPVIDAMEQVVLNGTGLGA